MSLNWLTYATPFASFAVVWGAAATSIVAHFAFGFFSSVLRTSYATKQGDAERYEFFVSIRSSCRFVAYRISMVLYPPALRAVLSALTDPEATVAVRVGAALLLTCVDRFCVSPESSGASAA